MSSCGWVTGIAGSMPFIYHDGTYITVQSSYVSSRGVNNYGDIVGAVGGGKVGPGSIAAVTLYGSTGARGIYSSTGYNSVGTGINDSITAVGTANSTFSPNKSLPFMFSDNQTTTLERTTSQLLGGVNSSGQIVGSAMGKTASRVFVYDGGYTYLKVTGAKSTVGHAINDAGTVVGYGLTAKGLNEGFMVAGGVGRFIGAAAGDYNHGSSLTTVNNHNQAVGFITNAAGATHALLYADGSLIDLNDVSDAPEPLVSAVGISDGGEIVANAASGASYLLLPGGVYPPNTCKTR